LTTRYITGVLVEELDGVGGGEEHSNNNPCIVLLFFFYLPSDGALQQQRDGFFNLFHMRFFWRSLPYKTWYL
jgi:hypothetical protein